MSDLRKLQAALELGTESVRKMDDFLGRPSGQYWSYGDTNRALLAITPTLAEIEAMEGAVKRVEELEGDKEAIKDGEYNMRKKYEAARLEIERLRAEIARDDTPLMQAVKDWCGKSHCDTFEAWEELRGILGTPGNEHRDYDKPTVRALLTLHCPPESERVRLSRLAEQVESKTGWTLANVETNRDRAYIEYRDASNTSPLVVGWSSIADAIAALEAKLAELHAPTIGQEIISDLKRLNASMSWLDAPDGDGPHEWRLKEGQKSLTRYVQRICGELCAIWGPSPVACAEIGGQWRKAVQG